VGLMVGVPRVQVGGDVEVTVVGPGGSPIPGVPASTTWILLPDVSAVALVAPNGWRSSPQSEVTFAPTSPGTSLLVNGRAYRGRIIAFRDRTGLTVVNRLGVEPYLAGVVSAELGRRDSTEVEALAAQAVVSRTFAVRNLGKRRSEGFDLYATVVDQVYGGITAETPLSWRAVRETSGLVLSFQGGLIDAFFFSTCGGQTAEAGEVFANGARPYLRSVHDEDASGQPYCRASPRYQWHEEWSGEELRAILQKSLPPVIGGTVPPLEHLRSVRVAQRTPSDHVARIVIEVGGREIAVEGPAIRQVLRPTPEQPLRSSRFTLEEETGRQGLVRLVAAGLGSGHGVGFCQWGAVGRARAGQGFAEILGAYFQETEIRRLF